MKLNKKGQWARRMLREQRSNDRYERLLETKNLLDEGFSIEKIALELNVSSNTIKEYIKEIKSDEENIGNEVKSRKEIKEHYYKLENDKNYKQEYADELKKEKVLSQSKFDIILTGIGWGILYSLIISLISFNFNLFFLLIFIFSPIIIWSKFSTYNEYKNKKSQFHFWGDLNSENNFEFECPGCKKNINIDINDMPKKEESEEFNCSNCDLEFEVKLPNNNYICQGCKKEFRNLKNKLKHSDFCKKYLEKSFECSECNNKFILDDDEFIKLSKNGKVDIECSKCKTKLKIK